ncbi:Flavin-containing monooxygenase FMO GS-OX-like 2, partial [Nymphaea thermarum]
KDGAQQSPSRRRIPALQPNGKLDIPLHRIWRGEGVHEDSVVAFLPNKRAAHCLIPLEIPTNQSLTGMEVAVIGAGAAGLVAAREMKREGHSVIVYERGHALGGNWVYTPEVESDDLLGLNPKRKVVHSSLYKSLRTNLPREAMGFLDYPFTARAGGDSRRFPGYREVATYLADFAREFDLEKWIRFRTNVVHVVRVGDGRWLVRARRVSDDGEPAADESQLFDAVVVCSGHFTEPRIADVPGLDRWPGKQIHSHNYREPEPFRDRVVVLIGGSASGLDISRDIAPVAKEVHLSSRFISDEESKRLPVFDNFWVHSPIKSTYEDGTVLFNDGSSVAADVIMHCTGYKFHYPFLDTNGAVTIEDNRVGPLYKHVFPPSLAPSLSFIGIPLRVLPFPLFELQSKWVAGVLSGRISLPSVQEMVEDVKAFYLQIEAAGYPKRYTHDVSKYLVSLNFPVMEKPLDYVLYLLGAELRSLLPPASTAALPPGHGLAHHASGDGDRSARAGCQETGGERGKDVAVIGAGAAGLAAGRELRREGHGVVVFERGNTVGGTWVYTPEVESPDLLGLDPSRTLVHSSVYESLRTNIPREVMGFLDYPFSARPSCDSGRFPSHQEVAANLADFAGDFDLVRWIRFETEVVNVVQHPDGRWLVRSRWALINIKYALCRPGDRGSLRRRRCVQWPLYGASNRRHPRYNNCISFSFKPASRL